METPQRELLDRLISDLKDRLDGLDVTFWIQGDRCFVAYRPVCKIVPLDTDKQLAILTIRVHPDSSSLTTLSANVKLIDSTVKPNYEDLMHLGYDWHDYTEDESVVNEMAWWLTYVGDRLAFESISLDRNDGHYFFTRLAGIEGAAFKDIVRKLFIAGDGPIEYAEGLVLAIAKLKGYDVEADIEEAKKIKAAARALAE